MMWGCGKTLPVAANGLPSAPAVWTPKKAAQLACSIPKVKRKYLNKSRAFMLQLAPCVSRMPSILAETESWIVSTAYAQHAGVDHRIDAGFVVEALESIQEFTQIKEVVFRLLYESLLPAMSTLASLCHGPLHNAEPPEALRRQSSLGQLFTKLTLDTIQDASAETTSAWKALARLQNSRALQHLVIEREPAAKNLVAWCAGISKFSAIRQDLHGLPNLVCRSRIHGRADLDHSTAIEELTAVFVDHDRRPHCERQALLGQIQHLLVKMKAQRCTDSLFCVFVHSVCSWQD